MDDSSKLEEPAEPESVRKDVVGDESCTVNDDAKEWPSTAETEEMSLEGGEADLIAKNEFEAPQPNSNAKSLAQDIAADSVIGESGDRSVSEDDKNDVKKKDSPADGDSAVKTETVTEESNCANDTSRTDDGNAMCTGVSEKEEQENPIGSNQESNPDPYDFSDQDSPQRGEDETGRANSNNIDVKMEHENDEAGEDDEREDFDVEYKRKPESFSPSGGGGGDDDDRLVIAEDDTPPPADEKKPTVRAEKKPRKKQNRFNGMSEDDVAKRLLPDLLAEGLQILIIGINPGMYAAYKGHHYAGPGNHFWKCMYLSGLISRPMTADDDYKLLDIGIGFTNIVERTTRGSGNLTRKEIVGGTKALVGKIKECKPKIAVFNGKGIYEIFSGKKDFHLGKQPEKIDGTDTYVWVMPNSSARCAQLPRAVDKVPFYEALKKFKDYLSGSLDQVDEEELVFSNVKLKNFNEGGKKQSLGSAAANCGNAGDSGGDAATADAAASAGPIIDARIDPLTGKKRRGRPPKPRPDGTLPPPKRRQLDPNGNPLPRASNPIDPITGKKKRGRPKKSDLQAAAAAAVVASGVDTDPDSGAPQVKEEEENATRTDLSKGSSTSAATSDCGSSNSSSIIAPSSKPTKVVPPLPPFSPHFCGASNGEDISDGGPEDHKSEEAPTANDPHAYDDPMHGQNGRLPQLCGDYPTATTDPSSTSNPGQNLEDFHPHHHPGYQQQYHQQQHHQHSPVAGTGGNFSPYHGSNASTNAFNNPAPASAKPDDVATKSISGLESLVDQIPAVADAESGVYSGGSGSAGNTPRSVGPYSPAATTFPSSSFHTPQTASASSVLTAAAAAAAALSSNGAAPPYGSSAAAVAAAAAAAAAAANQYNAPNTSDSLAESTNYPTSSATTDFSVNSLVQSSPSGGGGSILTQSSTVQPSPDVASDPFSVSSLTSDMASKYHHPASAAAAEAAAAAHHAGFVGGGGGGCGGNPYHGMFSTAAGSFAGAASGFLGGHAGHHTAAMMGWQYSNAYGATPPGFYTTHGLHMPNPSYPMPNPSPSYPSYQLPSPYGQSYSQSPYF